MIFWFLQVIDFAVQWGFLVSISLVFIETKEGESHQKDGWCWRLGAGLSSKEGDLDLEF